MSGFYVHVPFCKKKCSYCDFHFSTRFEGYREEMITSIGQEIIERKREYPSPLKSIYFGGGTPSLLTSKELSFLIKTIQENYIIDSSVEVTLEANPEDVSPENLLLWANIGFNRLSVGLQSFKGIDLKWMNRGHSAQEALSCISLAKSAGFNDISVDLMYGLPGLKKEEWVTHLKTVINAGVSHVSAYCLTVEKGTLLSAEVKKGKRSIPEDDIIEEQYLLLVSFLKENGFDQYEVSNFAKKERYSKHNSSYWKGISYIGVGPSAHSFKEGYRRWNVSNNSLYIKAFKEKKLYHEEEFLSHEEKWNELFLTGLRTKWGVSKSQITSFGGLTKKERVVLNQYILDGKLEEGPTQIVLSDSGFLFADAIAKDFFRVS